MSSVRSKFCFKKNILEKAMSNVKNNYGPTKLIIRIITYFFAKNKGLNIMCIHPGIVDTNLMKRSHLKKKVLNKMFNLITPLQSSIFILNIFYSKPKWSGEYIEIIKTGHKYQELNISNKDVRKIINTLEKLTNKCYTLFHNNDIIMSNTMNASLTD